MQVVFVEDDPEVQLGGRQALELAGFQVIAFENAEGARAAITPDFPGVVVTDIKLPGMDGLAFLKYCLSTEPRLPVILVTGHGDVTMAVQAMRDGAYDFIEKPCSSEHLVEVVQRALEMRRLLLENRDLRRRLEDRRGLEATLLGNSVQIGQLRGLIADLSDTSVDVLIRGETGTGKELVACCLHEHSPRRRGRFVALNCGALPEALFEGEVFGYEAGAFTGAARRHIGKLEFAAGGTVFLDEIESMPLGLQVKLLRVLQERRLERLGSNEQIQVDVRVIAATKEDLRELSEQRRFRADLYYRLNVATVELPPLRERREDIPPLFEHFVLEAATRYGREAPIASPAQMARLMAHAWPGNVRELRNVADRFVLGLLGAGFTLEAPVGESGQSLVQQVEAFEKIVIEQELRRHGGQVARVSQALGLPKKTLYDKLRKYSLTPENFR